MPASTIFQSFARGQALGDERKQNKLARQQQFLQLDNQRKGALFTDARTVNSFLKSGQIGQAMNVLSNRSNMLTQLGDNEQSDTLEVAGLIDSGDINGATSLLDSVEKAGIQGGFLEDLTGGDNIRVQSAQIFDDGTVLSVLRGGGRQVTNTVGEVVKGTQARDAIKQARASEVETRKKIESLKQETTLLNARAKGIVAAEGKTIEDGLFAAKGLPTLFRIETLLDVQDTGSPEQLKLWAKKKFGVESANEVELNNLLSKKVLQQIKPLFGAAPSQAEGQWLRDIEATYGTSTEGNRVLVQRGISLANERVRQGVEAATARGDSRTVKNLQDWQNFRVDSPTLGAAKAQGGAAQAGAPAQSFNFDAQGNLIQ